MSRPKLLFVGHGYHLKTGSSAFFVDLLRRHFEVVTVWDGSWDGSTGPLDAPQLNGHGADLVVFFQVLPRRRVLQKLDCRRLFWVPMRDGVSLKPGPWRRLRPSGLRLVSFCAEMHRYAVGHGLASLPVEYWPPLPPAPAIADDAPLHILFWMRRGNLGWPTLKALLGETRPARIVIRASADPGETLQLPDEADCREYRIERVDRWLEKADYEALLQGCNVYVAPRLQEGIGLSFLEAMALGQAVIAPDRATMNEYLRHGGNGWLFDPERPRPLDFSQVPALRRAARADAERGRAQWLAAEPALAAWLADPAPQRPSWWWRLARWLP